MLKYNFQKGVYKWLPWKSCSKTCKEDSSCSYSWPWYVFTISRNIIFTAGLGAMITADLDVIFKANHDVIMTAGLDITSTADADVIVTVARNVGLSLIHI